MNRATAVAVAIGRRQNVPSTRRAPEPRDESLSSSAAGTSDAVCHPERSACHYPNLGAEKVVASQLPVTGRKTLSMLSVEALYRRSKKIWVMTSASLRMTRCVNPLTTGHWPHERLSRDPLDNGGRRQRQNRARSPPRWSNAVHLVECIREMGDALESHRVRHLGDRSRA